MERLDTLVGQILDDRYHLLSLVGQGGSAVVFRADDLLLHRPVAVKMLRSEAAAQLDAQDKKREQNDKEAREINRSAFKREALAASVLAHPNIVAVYDVSPEGDNPYIVMEYVDGTPLSSLLESGEPLPLDKTYSVVQAALSALEEAHEMGIVHRDIKAQNILLCKDGSIKLTDFGIAEVPGISSRILKNKVLGTPETISPEQASGLPSDERADLYSLGIVLYQMATGRLPFVADDPQSVLLLQQSEPPVYPSTYNPDLPFGLEQIILTALKKNPDNRFATARDMRRAIAKAEENPAVVFRRFPTKKRSKLLRFFFSRGPLFFSAVGVAFLFVALALWFIFVPRAALPSCTVVVMPDYVGSYASAVALDDRITVEVRYQYAPAEEEGRILFQSIAAGSRLKLDGKDDRITFVVTVATHQGD